MKKKESRKLALHKETVRTLEQGSLRAVQGGNSINWSQCISECIPCDIDYTSI
jgi:hypothetical protein